MQLIGIELSQTYIKYIEVIKKRQKLLIKNGQLLKITSSYDQKKVVRWIQKINPKYRRKKMIVVVNDFRTIIRQLILPCESELTISQQLEMKPEIYLPIERGTHQVRFKILKPLEEQKEKMVVQFVAVPNLVINSAIQLAKNLKSRLVSINIPSEALTTLFSGDKPSIGCVGQNVLLLDIGIGITKILVIESNGGYLVRFVQFGIQHMKAIAQAYFEETYQTFNKNNLIKLIYLQIDYYIVLEIERLLKFYETRYASFNIQGIYLMSELKIEEEFKIREYISRALNIETYSITHIKDVESQIQNIIPFLYLIGAIKAL